MRRQRKTRRSAHSIFGTPQNPDALRDGMSWEEAQALRKREIEKDRAEAKKILTEMVEDLAREKGIPIPWEQQPAASPGDVATDTTAAAAPEIPEAQTAGSSTPQDSESPAETIAIETTCIPRPARRRRLLGERVAKRLKPLAGEESSSAIERHSRKCGVCHHKDREDIESDFLHWHDPEEIALDFDLRSARVIYRHARATGLYELRMLNLRDVAALVASRAEQSKASGATILNAIRACSLINESGEWFEPPTRVIHYAVVGEPPMLHAALAEKFRSGFALPAAEDSTDEKLDEPRISNRQLVKLKSHVTARKQTKGVPSNRH
jgi:hypothetical protein